jgi:hypothetical protein
MLTLISPMKSDIFEASRTGVFSTRYGSDHSDVGASFMATNQDSIPAPLKRCYRCKEQKSRADFHKDRRNPSGLQAACRSCASAYKAKVYVAHPRVREALPAGTKRVAVLILLTNTASPITVSCRRAGKSAPRRVGGVFPSFNGANRSSVRGEAKVIPIATSYLTAVGRECYPGGYRERSTNRLLGRHPRERPDPLFVRQL